LQLLLVSGHLQLGTGRTADMHPAITPGGKQTSWKSCQHEKPKRQNQAIRLTVLAVVTLQSNTPPGERPKRPTRMPNPVLVTQMTHRDTRIISASPPISIVGSSLASKRGVRSTNGRLPAALGPPSHALSFSTCWEPDPIRQDSSRRPRPWMEASGFA
jgi:hypothetical protein